MHIFISKIMFYSLTKSVYIVMSIHRYGIPNEIILFVIVKLNPEQNIRTMELDYRKKLISENFKCKQR